MLFVAVESFHVSFLTALLGCFLRKAEVFTITSLLLREYNRDYLLYQIFRLRRASSHLPATSFRQREGKGGTLGFV